MTFPISFHKIIYLNIQETGISSKKYILRRIEEEVRNLNVKIINYSDNEITFKQNIFYYPDRFKIKVNLKGENIIIKTTSFTWYGFGITLTFLIALLISQDNLFFSFIGTFWIFFIFYSETYMIHMKLNKSIEKLKYNL